MTRSDEAQALAGHIACGVWYPRAAEFISYAIRFCTMDAEPLTDSQCEQIYRAAFEAGDGVLDSIAGVLDARTAYRLLEDHDERNA